MEVCRLRPRSGSDLAGASLGLAHGSLDLALGDLHFRNLLFGGLDDPLVQVGGHAAQVTAGVLEDRARRACASSTMRSRVAGIISIWSRTRSTRSSAREARSRRSAAAVIADVSMSDCSSIRLATAFCDTAVILTPERAIVRTGDFRDFSVSAEPTAVSRTVSTDSLRIFCDLVLPGRGLLSDEFLHLVDHGATPLGCDCCGAAFAAVHNNSSGALLSNVGNADARGCPGKWANRDANPACPGRAVPQSPGPMHRILPLSPRLTPAARASRPARAAALLAGLWLAGALAQPQAPADGAAVATGSGPARNGNRGREARCPRIRPRGRSRRSRRSGGSKRATRCTTPSACAIRASSR